MVELASPTPAPRAPARIALAHDWLVGMRGGERVLDRLARLTTTHHDPAGLFVMFDDRTPHTPAIDALDRTVSRLGTAPGASTTLRRWLLPAYPSAVRSLTRALAHAHAHAHGRAHAERPIDLLVSTSSAAVKNITPPVGVPHLCYCHAPARYLWSRTDDYSGSLPRALGLKLFANRLRAWDRNGARTVTRFVANSTHIANEIARVYDRDADVVHPPARTAYFTPDIDTPRDDFWLVAGALEPYKRTDLAIDAAVRANHTLVIAGDGSQSHRLRAHARKHAPPGLIRFEGRVPDERLRDLFRRARCLLHPQVEDFGIIAIEAQACGCPVVALRAGGALDTVREHTTGAFFDDPTPDALARVAAECPTDPAACRAHAETFSEQRFDERMLAVITQMLE